MSLSDQENKTTMISDSIPTELIMEILSRLPSKSIARFHCVSKQWESLFGRPYFRELFLTRSSSAQPRILFAIEKEGLWSIFSVPQRLLPYEKSSSSLEVSAEFHMKFPPDNMVIDAGRDGRFTFGYASGLMYFYGMEIKGQNYRRLPVICNPITGGYATLPPFLYKYWCTVVHSFFGFDPIDKQFKVLSIEYPFRYNHHKIMTLEPGEMRWRRIKCSFKHAKVSEGICVNGVLYYLGETCEDKDDDEDEYEKFVLVCFDVRSEKFRFIYLEKFCQLINYMGKLGVIHYDYTDDAMELLVWVLEDFEKQDWSKYEYTPRDDKFLPYVNTQQDRCWEEKNMIEEYYSEDSCVTEYKYEDSEEYDYDYGYEYEYEDEAAYDYSVCYYEDEEESEKEGEVE